MTERKRVIPDVPDKTKRSAAPRRKGKAAPIGESETWLRVAVDLMGLAPFTWDIVTSKLDWDGRLKRLWGLPEDSEVDCDLFLSAIHPDDRPTVQDGLARALDPDGDGTYAGEFRVVGLGDRVERWVSGRGQAFFAGGRATKFVGVVVEITERKRAEDILLQSEAEFRALFELSGVGQVQTDASALQFVRVNRKFCEITGYSPQELAHLTATDLTHPDDRAASDALWDRVRAGELPEYSIEKRYIRKDGRPVWVHVSATILRDSTRRPWLTAGIIEDITERKEAQQALQESEREFRSLFELSRAGQVQADAVSRRFIRVNRKFCELTGYSADELTRMTAIDLTHPDDRAADEEQWRRRLSGEAVPGTVEKRYLRKDGSIIWVQVTANVLRLPDGRPWRTAAVIDDITERKKAGDAVRTSEERLRLALEAGDMGAWEWDLDTGEVVWDRSFYDLIGLDHRTRPTVERFASLLHPDDASRINETVAAILAGDESALNREFRIVRPDGAVRWLRSAGAIEHTGTGQRRAIGVYMDVTESKARDEHLLLLMRELAHRSKNQLAMVQAIARQTTRQSESFEAFDRQFSARIQALAECNDILMKRDWQGAPIADIVQAQMKVFAAYQSQIEMAGAPITLSAAATQNVGLALHELATNALKHGALSRPTGKVTINWEVVSAPEPRLRIIWMEEGGPPAKQPERKGFGSVVLERATPAALNGTGRLEYLPEGLRWELEIPCRHVVHGADTRSLFEVRG